MDIEHLAKNLFYAYYDDNPLISDWDIQAEYIKDNWIKVAEFVLKQEQYIKRVRVDNKVIPFVDAGN